MGEIREILKNRVALLLMLQFCCIRVWDFWIVSHTYAQTAQQWWAYPGFSNCLVCILLLIAGNRLLIRIPTWANAVIVVLASLSTMGFSGITGLVISDVWIDVLYVVAGATLAWLCIRCVMSISQLPITQIIIVILFGSILSALLTTIIAQLPGNVGSILTALLPFALCRSTAPTPPPPPLVQTCCSASKKIPLPFCLDRRYRWAVWSSSIRC
ncbi:MAG: hypothetical protein LBK67_00585 [Coriobacteriales bacterium]|nr:hypothetical protein [Coriobacteriales bacterium]